MRLLEHLRRQPAHLRGAVRRRLDAVSLFEITQHLARQRHHPGGVVVGKLDLGERPEPLHVLRGLFDQRGELFRLCSPGRLSAGTHVGQRGRDPLFRPSGEDCLFVRDAPQPFPQFVTLGGVQAQNGGKRRMVPEFLPFPAAGLGAAFGCHEGGEPRR